MSSALPLRVEQLGKDRVTWEDFGLLYADGHAEEAIDEVLSYTNGRGLFRVVDSRTGTVVVGPRGLMVIEAPKTVYETVER